MAEVRYFGGANRVPQPRVQDHQAVLGDRLVLLVGLVLDTQVIRQTAVAVERLALMRQEHQRILKYDLNLSKGVDLNNCIRKFKKIKNI